MFVGVTERRLAVVSRSHERVLLALRTRVWRLKQGMQVDDDSCKIVAVYPSLAYLARSRLIPVGGGDGMVSCLLHVLQCPLTRQQTVDFPSAGMNRTVTGGWGGALSCAFCKWNRNAMTGSGV